MEQAAFVASSLRNDQELDDGGAAFSGSAKPEWDSLSSQ